jgi:hypothetical protein
MCRMNIVSSSFDQFTYSPHTYEEGLLKYSDIVRRRLKQSLTVRYCTLSRTFNSYTARYAHDSSHLFLNCQFHIIGR